MTSQKIRNCVKGLREQASAGHLDRAAFELGMQVLLSLADEVECMEELPVPNEQRFASQDGVIDFVPYLKAHGCRIPAPPAGGAS